ncbi:MAG: J domain-containing protein [Pirellulaceae bacterium]
MAEDYYRILGLDRNATADQIRKAHRDLARKYHPDLNPDDKSAKTKFQEVQKAYEVLSDPKKREMYDRFGSGFEQASSGAGAGPQWQTGPGGPQGNPFEDIDLSQIFGGGQTGGANGGFGDFFRQFTGGRSAAGGKQGRRTVRGNDIEYELQVAFRTAVSGGQAQLSVRRPSGKLETITVKVPQGIADGKKIRLRGQGEPVAGGTPGDILITVKVAPHPHFQRTGNDLVVKVPVTLAEAALGGKVDVPTPQGTISLSIPPCTSSGKRLRIKGHGVVTKDKTGDLYAEIQITLPETLTVQQQDLVRQLNAEPSEPLRKNLVW